MGMNKSLDVYIISIEGRDAEENAMFYPPPLPPKKPLINQIHLENEPNACVIH